MIDIELDIPSQPHHYIYTRFLGVDLYYCGVIYMHGIHILLVGLSTYWGGSGLMHTWGEGGGVEYLMQSTVNSL